MRKLLVRLSERLREEALFRGIVAVLWLLMLLSMIPAAACQEINGMLDQHLRLALFVLCALVIGVVTVGGMRARIWAGCALGALAVTTFVLVAIMQFSPTVRMYLVSLVDVTSTDNTNAATSVFGALCAFSFALLSFPEEMGAWTKRALTVGMVAGVVGILGVFLSYAIFPQVMMIFVNLLIITGTVGVTLFIKWQSM